MISSLFRIIKYTFRHLARNGWQSLMVVLVLAVTFFIVQSFFMLGIASDRIIKYFETQPQVTVFFKDEATPEQILQMKAELEKDSNVKSVAYISKEQALEIYRSEHRDDPDLLEFVTADILPASIEISVNNVDYLSEIASRFNNNQFVEQVYYQGDLVDELTAWTTNLRKAGIVLMVIMMFVASVIIVLVIANNINMFGHEIEVMRLVGAGNFYIRMPFVLDGVIFAVIATLIASVALYWSLPYVEAFADQLIAATELFPDPALLVTDLMIKTVSIGAVLTAIVSYISVWKYLKI